MPVEITTTITGYPKPGCPGVAASVVLSADDLLRRLAEWDVLFVGSDGQRETADAPYWQQEIAKVRQQIAEAVDV